MTPDDLSVLERQEQERDKMTDIPKPEMVFAAAPTLTDHGIFLRELETQLAAVQISVKSGIAPHAGINCARMIMADVLKSAGMAVNPGLPAIEADAT